MSKTVADKLRAHLLSQGIEGIPSSNSTFFNVLQDHGIIQPNAEGKAIWKAAVDSGSWQMTLTFLKLSPALIWDADDRPPPFAGSVEPVSVSERPDSDGLHTEPAATASDFETLKPMESDITPVQEEVAEGEQTQDDAVDELLELLNLEDFVARIPQIFPIDANECPKSITAESVNNVGNVLSGIPGLHIFNNTNKLGEHFIQWVRSGVIEHKIVINDAKAKVHTVADTAFIVTPEIFQRYAQEHTEILKTAKQENMSDWRLVQRSFEKLGIHKKREDGLNIWTCEVKGPRKTRNVKGYLLQDYSVIFTDKPYNNPYLTIINS